MISLMIHAVQWAAALFVAAAAVRVATSLVAAWRPPAASKPRRDARWLLGWLLMLAVGMALVRAQIGGYYSFSDPSGSDWNFDAHGWPLAEPHALFRRFGSGGSAEAVYWTAIAVDLLCSLLLLVATRVVVDRWLAAWDAPTRWQSLGREVGGCCLALLAVLVCERLAARPLTFPGSEMIVYTTLIYEPAEIRIGVLIGLTSAVFLLGMGATRGVAAVKRLRAEGVI